MPSPNIATYLAPNSFKLSNFKASKLGEIGGAAYYNFVE